MLRAVLSRWKPAICAGLALVGLLPTGALAVEKEAVSLAADDWAPNEDDRWLFDLRSGQYRLGDGVRGYQTPQGVCVDLADMVLALDLAKLFQRFALGVEWARRRMKAVRFHVLCIAARVVESGRRLLVKLSERTSEAAALLQGARDRIQALARASPTPSAT